MGVQQLPPPKSWPALPFYMTVVIVFPVGKQINDQALQPYLNEQIDYKIALDRAQMPLRNFMFRSMRGRKGYLRFSTQFPKWNCQKQG